MATLAETRRDQMFPVLGADQIAWGCRLRSGDLLFALGTRDAAAFLVLQGCTAVVFDVRGGGLVG